VKSNQLPLLEERAGTRSGFISGRASILLALILIHLGLVVGLTALFSAGDVSAGSPSGALPSETRDQGIVTSTIYFPIFMKIPTYTYDMADFMLGDGRLYEVWHSNDSQARHQSQGVIERFYHTKGDEIKAEWEELWATEGFIMRGTDTSPGNDMYYTLRDDGQYGSRWSPRRWRPGDIYERNPHVTFYYKNNCQPVVGGNGMQQSWLRFEAYYPVYAFGSGIVLSNVIELAWLLQPNGQPVESYFYARDYGLVGWSSASNGYSYISEIHAPGARPDNTREVISCLDQSPIVLDRGDLEPLPPPFRAK